MSNEINENTGGAVDLSKKNKQASLTVNENFIFVKHALTILMLLIILCVIALLLLIADIKKPLLFLFSVIIFVFTSLCFMVLAVFFGEKKLTKIGIMVSSSSNSVTQNLNSGDNVSSVDNDDLSSVTSDDSTSELDDLSSKESISEASSSCLSADDENVPIDDFSTLCRLIEEKQLELDIYKGGNFIHAPFETSLSLFLLLALFWCSNKEQRMILQRNFKDLCKKRHFNLSISLEKNYDIEKYIKFLSMTYPLGETSKIEVYIPKGLKQSNTDEKVEKNLDAFEKSINTFKQFLSENEQKFFVIKHHNADFTNHFGVMHYTIDFCIKSNCSIKFNNNVASYIDDGTAIKILSNGDDEIFVNQSSNAAAIQNIEGELILCSHEPITDAAISNLMEEKDQDVRESSKDSVSFPLYSMNNVSEQYFTSRRQYIFYKNGNEIPIFDENGTAMVNVLLKDMNKIFDTFSVSDFCLKMEQNQSLDLSILPRSFLVSDDNTDRLEAVESRNFVYSKEGKLYITVLKGERKFETVLYMPEFLQIKTKKICDVRKDFPEIYVREIKGYIQTKAIDDDKIKDYVQAKADDDNQDISTHINMKIGQHFENMCAAFSEKKHIASH